MIWLNGEFLKLDTTIPPNDRPAFGRSRVRDYLPKTAAEAVAAHMGGWAACALFGLQRLIVRDHMPPAVDY
ncbi:MAG: hypothetical protein CM15mP55_2820 [Hyphomicrobiales bacterium]|nr:MAG: hypothetical protein CM15mP55_2820 [Hyphomicrobiales bacterium]